VQLSIWPGGAETNAKGTIDWAGGPIDWNSEDIQNYGYDFATFGQVEVECYNATSGPGTNSKTSYTYSDARGTNDTIVDGDKGTILKSFSGTGLDMNAGGSSSSSGASASGTATKSASGAVASVPGGTASGPGSSPGEQGDGVSSAGSGDGAGGSSTGSSAGCQATGFSQDCGGSSSSSGNGGTNAGARVVERTVGASALAVLVAVGGMMWL